MAQFGKGSVTVACPVCGDDWEVAITGDMIPARGRPGRARVRVTARKPIRIPHKHRSCIGKVD